jgi:hypothetical protein
MLLLLPPPDGLNAQQREVVAHAVSVSNNGARVTFELEGGREITIALENGSVLVDGSTVARYSPNSEVYTAWHATLEQAGRLSSTELLAAVREWQNLASEQAPEVEAEITRSLDQLAAAEELGAELAVRAEAMQGSLSAALIDQAAEVTERLQLEMDDLVIDLSQINSNSRGLAIQLDELRGQLNQVDKLGIQVDNARIHMGDLTIPRERTIDTDLVVLAGDVSIFGTVNGNVIALDGDVLLHRGGSVQKDIVTVNGRTTRAGGSVGGRVRSSGLELRRSAPPPSQNRRMVSPVSNGTSIASLLGMFIALSCIGFGFTFFAPRQLDIVADTVTDSFGKSFFAGLFATPLLLPAFVILIVGLAISVVGLLLIPFAIVGSILAVIAAGTGGYLAVAKSVGSTYLTRRAAQGHAVTITPYRSLLFGLAGLMAIWIPAAVLGWIPVMGPALALLAAIFTWVMVTAGFGAAILSRAGIRATFVNARQAGALTDEHYWPIDTGSHSIPRETSRRVD